MPCRRATSNPVAICDRIRSGIALNRGHPDERDLADARALTGGSLTTLGRWAGAGVFVHSSLARLSVRRRTLAIRFHQGSHLR